MRTTVQPDDGDGVETVSDAGSEPRPQSPVTGRRVAGNVIWNLFGQGLPIVVAIVCIPFLTRNLGTDRFGLLALSWTFVGYFSIFDLGLATAMERSIAQKLSVGDHKSIHVTVWTALLVMLALGIAGLVVAWTAAPAIIHALRASSALQDEALRTVQLLALSIPLVVVGAGLRGVLAAHMKFKLINAVGVPLGMWTYLGPIAVLPFSRSLVLIVAVLLLGRLAGFAVYVAVCLRLVPSLRSLAFHRALVRPLLTFGGWLTLDDLVDPLTNFLDRFLIGSLLSVAAVAYYTVPYQLAAQGWILASGLSGVLFPVFSGALAGHGDQARLIFRRSVKYLLFAMFPIVLLMVGLAHPGLQLWLGGQYADQSAAVLQLVAVGVLITSIGSIGGTYNGSAGRPDVNAKLALAKFTLHFAPAWWVIANYGIAGLAALWMVCAGLESLGMVVYALRSQGIGWMHILRRILQSFPVWALLGIAALSFPLAWKLAYIAAALAGMGTVAWHSLMTRGERRLVRSQLRIKPVPEALSGL